MKRLASLAAFVLFAALPVSLAQSAAPQASVPDYSIQAIRYASAEDQVAGLVVGAPKGEKIQIAMVVWLIRGGGRDILRQRLSPRHLPEVFSFDRLPSPG